MFLLAYFSGEYRHLVDAIVNIMQFIGIIIQMPNVAKSSRFVMFSLWFSLCPCKRKHSFLGHIPRHSCHNTEQHDGNY